MTHDDTLILMALFKAAWPSYYRDMKRSGAEDIVSVWAEMLSDLPPELVTTAAQRMIATLKFPPSIADIRESVAHAMADASGEPTAGEAWSKVRKALRRFGYYRPDEAREYLGADLWQAVDMLGGWSYTCTTDDDTSTLSAQFERRYKAMQEQRKQQVQIPQAVRDRMTALVGSDKPALPGGFDGLVKRLTGGAAQ